MAKQKQVLNLMLYALALGFASLVPFLMLPILSKELTVAEFGILALIEVSILFLIPFVSLKIEAGIGVEYFKLGTRNFKIYVFNAFFASLLSFCIVLGIFILFQDTISNLIGLTPYYILMLPIFALLRVVGSVILTIYRSKQESVSFFYLSIAQTAVDFALSYFLVVILKEGIDGRLWGVYFAFSLTSLWGIIYFFRNGYFSFRSLKHLKKVYFFSLPLVPHALAGVFIVMSDRYFLSYFFGAESVGLYAASYQIAALMLLVGTIMNQVWAPQLYKWLKAEHFSMGYKYGLIISLGLVVVSIFIFMLENVLYHFLVDEKFYDSKPFFIWLLIGFLFQSLYFIVTNYLFFYKKTVVLSVVTVSIASINLLLNYFMIKEFSAIGVAYATALTWFLLFTAVLYIVYRKKLYCLKKV